jgi:hypothetical protein
MWYLHTSLWICLFHHITTTILFLSRSWVKIPTPLLKAYEQHKVLDYKSADLPHLSSDQVMDLAQWSDLILYDYITGNYDR